MRYTSTITSKGQITIPAKLRKKKKMKPSDQVQFIEKGNDIVVERIPTIDELAGSLYNPDIKPLSAKQMSKMIDDGIFSNKYGSS